MRTRVPLIALAPSGALLSGATVTITNRQTGTATTVYGSEFGGGVLPQPLVTDVRGRVPGWVERGAYSALFVSGTDTWSEDFESVPGRDKGVDSGWIDDSAVIARSLASGAVLLDKLGPNSVDASKISDVELSSIAGLISGADLMPYYTGLGAAALAPLSAQGRALVDDSDATTQRATIGAPTFAPEAVVSSLPTSGLVNGQEVYYLADSTNGIVWHLKYRLASSSAYKWEFVGGSALRAYVDAIQALPTAWGTPATSGPDVTVPLAGDYEIVWGGKGNIVGNSNYGVMGVTTLNGVPVYTADWTTGASGGNDYNYRSASMRHVFAGYPAGTTFQAKYLAGAATVSVGLRYMYVRPVRVG
jgi:hypothetical protein